MDTLHISRRLDKDTASDRETSTAVRPPNLSAPDEQISSYRTDTLSVSRPPSALLSLKFNFSVVKEVYVFEFGAAVFWGFSLGEEEEMLELIRGFVSRQFSIQESTALTDDDMGFILVSGEAMLTIVSDILYLPENYHTKQRLAISFALGQSTVLSLFESQVDTKIPEYTHIPQTLKEVGRIGYMSSGDVGKLIGELFVIRHNLNLHSDILDIPDFFWEEDKYEPEYNKLWKYLEMDGRVSVLNKRLDLIKEMLDLLRFHVERGETTNLDWIIIILIVLYCFIEVGGMLL